MGPLISRLAADRRHPGVLAEFGVGEQQLGVVALAGQIAAEPLQVRGVRQVFKSLRHRHERLLPIRERLTNRMLGQPERGRSALRSVRRVRHRSGVSGVSETVPPGGELPALLERWVASGIITSEQAERIRADAAARPAPAGHPAPAGQPERPAPRGASLVTEAIGYLGGVIVLVGLGLVLGQLWDDLSIGTRLGVAGGATAILLAAGAAVRRGLGAAGHRLRAVLWLAGVAALAGFLGLAGAEAFEWDGELVSLFVGGGCAAVGAALWWWHRHVLQHLATMVSTAAAAASAAALLPDSGNLPGLAIWGVGSCWVGLALGGWLPWRAGTVLGAIASIVGAVTVAGQDWGALLALGTVAGLVVAAVRMRELVLLGVAAVGTLVVLPVVIDRLFPGVLAAAIVLVVVGLLLVLVAVATARRRSREAGERSSPDRSGCPSRPALAGVGLLALAITGSILGAGLG
jgi:hypothetical protein